MKGGRIVVCSKRSIKSGRIVVFSKRSIIIIIAILIIVGRIEVCRRRIVIIVGIIIIGTCTRSFIIFIVIVAGTGFIIIIIIGTRSSSIICVVTGMMMMFPLESTSWQRAVGITTIVKRGFGRMVDDTTSTANVGEGLRDSKIFRSQITPDVAFS